VFSVHTLAQGVWIPGLRQQAHPGTTGLQCIFLFAGSYRFWYVRDNMRKKQKRPIGSSFDDFLKEEGIYEAVTARAIKRVIARQLDALMQEQGISKTELARSMKTSRAQLDRLLDPDNESVTLGTLTRAALAVGRNLRMELVCRW
jgi:antitoxin HicB